jgi:aldehyde:ferredoxin oxidoreductase
MKYDKQPLVRGYANRILNVDVGSGRMETPALNEGIRDFFLGGRALALYLLHQAVTASTRAYDPENALILAPGPLGGIPQFPGTGKCMAVSLSPQTGIPGVSNFGGHFGAYLKYAGFDALQITGKAAEGVMIVIDAFRKEITLEAAPMTDQVFDLEQRIVTRFEKEGYEKRNIVFLTTGVGAVHTTYGCINSHYYDATKPVDGGRGCTDQTGRTDRLGSVMADKKVRAVVVLSEFPRGENPYGAADCDKVKKAGTKLGQVIREVDPQSLRMARKGSAGLISFMNKEEYQSLPVHNYQLGSDPRAGSICGKSYEENLFEHRGMDGCFPGCNLQCTNGGGVTLRSGEHRGRKVWVDGPEYETAAVSAPTWACGIPSSSWRPTGTVTITGSTRSPRRSFWPSSWNAASGAT